jgi:hypothetical protein
LEGCNVAWKGTIVACSREIILTLTCTCTLSFDISIVASHDPATRVADLEAHIHKTPPTQLLSHKADQTWRVLSRCVLPFASRLARHTKHPAQERHNTTARGRLRSRSLTCALRSLPSRLKFLLAYSQARPRSHPPLSTCTRAVTFRSLDRPPTRPSGTPAPRYWTEK